MDKRELTQYGNRCTPARDLRSCSTGAEKKLGFRLRNRQLGGYTFRRQVPIGPFFADFCCMEARLIIELDGNQHRLTVDQDSNRSHVLRERGFQVLRFWNYEVLKQTDAVCSKILAELKKSSLNDPLPVGEGPARATR